MPQFGFEPLVMSVKTSGWEYCSHCQSCILKFPFQSRNAHQSWVEESDRVLANRESLFVDASDNSSDYWSTQTCPTDSAESLSFG